jgi:hypothetical protein
LKSGFIDLIGKARKNRGERFRHQLYIFAVCFLISLFIWTLVRLSREYYYTVNYHIQFTGLPSQYRLKACSDSILTVSIKIQGFDFFTEEFIHPKNQKYTVNLRKIKVHGGDEGLKGFLPTAEIGREIKGQMNYPSEVYMVFPDTLYFLLDRAKAPKGLRNGARDVHADILHDSDSLGQRAKGR